jgi:hypothetical protein
MSSGVSASGSEIGAVGHQATVVHKLTPWVYRREPILCSQVGDPFSIRIGQRVRRYGESGATRLNRLFELDLEFVGVTYLP